MYYTKDVQEFTVAYIEYYNKQRYKVKLYNMAPVECHLKKNKNILQYLETVPCILTHCRPSPLTHTIITTLYAYNNNIMLLL